MQPPFTVPQHQNARAWLKHPLLIPWLPYSVRTTLSAHTLEATWEIFDASREPWREVAYQGLLTTVQRRYELVWGSEGLSIHGPYGHKAWRMTTLVTIALDERGTWLTLRTVPHWSILLGMVVQMAFSSAFAVAVGMPAAPWFPLIFFGSFMYVATVIATKVEAARVASLIRQAEVALASPPA